jgi:hypothetical protein
MPKELNPWLETTHYIHEILYIDRHIQSKDRPYNSSATNESVPATVKEDRRLIGERVAAPVKVIGAVEVLVCWAGEVPFVFVVVVANEAVVANVVPALAVSVATTWTVLVPVAPREVSVLNEMLMIVVLIECQQYARDIVFRKTYIRAGPRFCFIY